MEQLQNVVESTELNDTQERIDTWNEQRSPEVLSNFVTSRLVKLGEFTEEDLFDLAA